MKDNLIRVSTYAEQIDKSVQWVYELIKKDKVKIIIIDGVKFVEL